MPLRSLSRKSVRKGKRGGKSRRVRRSRGSARVKLSILSKRRVRSVGSGKRRYQRKRVGGSYTEEGTQSDSPVIKEFKSQTNDEDVLSWLTTADKEKPLFINLNECKNVSDVSVTSIATHCSHLVALLLCNTAVTDNSITQVATSCSELQALMLDYTAVTDASVIAVAEGCPNLKLLFLNDIGVTDKSISTVATNCPKLEDLVLNGTAVTDKSVLVVARNCSKLKKLFLNNTGVTDTSVYSVVANCLMLEKIGLDTTPNVTRKCIFDVQSKSISVFYTPNEQSS